VRPLNLLPPRFENQTFWETIQESVLLTDKSLRVIFLPVSFLEHNLYQQVSVFNFCSFNSTRKVNIHESFVSSTFKPVVFNLFCSITPLQELFFKIASPLTTLVLAKILF